MLAGFLKKDLNLLQKEFKEKSKMKKSKDYWTKFLTNIFWLKVKWMRKKMVYDCKF